MKDITAIRTHLSGEIEVSTDHCKTWQKFEGIVINAAATEHAQEVNSLLEQKAS